MQDLVHGKNQTICTFFQGFLKSLCFSKFTEMPFILIFEDKLILSANIEYSKLHHLQFVALTGASLYISTFVVTL